MMNSVQLIGRIASDPELSYTPNGVAKTTFRIAVQRDMKSTAGAQQADFINVIAWKGSAEYLTKYPAKGRLFGVIGHIETSSFVDKDGQQQYRTRVNAHRVWSLEKPKDYVDAEGTEDQPETSGELADPFDDE